MIEPNRVTYRSTSVANVVELEYHLLHALREYLGEATVTRDYGTTKYGFKVNDTQRALVSVTVEDIRLCTTCKLEIENPSYSQKLHIGCEETPAE